MIVYKDGPMDSGDLTGYWDVGLTRRNSAVVEVHYYTRANKTIVSCSYLDREVTSLTVDGENWLVEDWESRQ